MNWIYAAEFREQWTFLCKTIMNLSFTVKIWNYLTRDRLVGALG
jgi:hypothetical protein